MDNIIRLAAGPAAPTIDNTRRNRPMSPSLTREWNLFWAVAAISLIAGCNRAAPPQAGAAQAGVAKPGGGKLRPSVSAVSDDEARKFAESMERFVAEGKAGEAGGLIDWNALATASTDVPDCPQKLRQSAITSYRNELTGPNGIYQTVIKQVSSGGSYKLLRVHAAGDQTRALFRMLLPGQGLNYHDVVLEKGPGGVVRGKDMFVFLSGEFLSQTLRRTFIPIVASKNRGILDRLTGREGDYMRSLPAIQRIIDGNRDGDSQAALAAFEGLPDSVKKEKNVQLFRFQAAQKLDEANYARAIEDLRRLFPEDASIDLLMIDGFTLKKQYSEVLGCIDRLERSIGGDPYLECLRANAQFAAGDLPAASASARKAIERDPTLLDSYWTLVTLSMKEGISPRHSRPSGSSKSGSTSSSETSRRSPTTPRSRHLPNIRNG